MKFNVEEFRNGEWAILYERVNDINEARELAEDTRTRNALQGQTFPPVRVTMLYWEPDDPPAQLGTE